MKKFFHSLAFKILSAIAALLVGIMIYAASTRGVAGIPEVMTGVIVTPIQSAFSYISDGFSSFWSNLTQMGAKQDKIDELQSEIDELRNQLVELDELRRQNELYKDYLGIKEQHPTFEMTAGRVIAANPLDGYGNFTINAGSSRGVKVSDPVITSAGLVGVVSEVGPNWANVKTILDPSVQVSALVSRNNNTCVTAGSGSLALDGLLRVELLPRDTGAASGDIILTSGVGGRYPASLKIGEIVSFAASSDGLTMTATIRPFADISSLGSVMVITSFAE